MDELAEIFADLGFSVATGPEIEDDWHNFTALNMPESHPARAMHDTFYFPDARTATRAGEMLLRTHTSPGADPHDDGAAARRCAIIAPGRVYRSDSDATHTPMFHQVEGLVIDRDIHLGHLKWTLETFLKAFFEREDIVLRLRPSYFPFTEPSVEVDVGYALENGKRVLGGSGDAPGHGWMELLGSGMVNRRVHRDGGLDPDEWQGFAFGVGVDRLAMLKYGMDDLRAFFDGDVRWLTHYGFSFLDQPTLSARRGSAGGMKFSLAWLSSTSRPRPRVAGDRAPSSTRIGLEVEGVEDPAEKLAGFRVAKVLTAAPPPQCRQAAGADRRHRRRRAAAGGLRRAQCARGPGRRARPAGRGGAGGRHRAEEGAIRGVEIATA